MPPTTKKDAVNKATEIEDLSDTDYDTEEFGRPPLRTNSQKVPQEKPRGRNRLLEGGPQ